MNKIFSKRLRMLIEERDLTQKQLACDLQLPASTLGGYVQGISEPDYDMLKKIAGYFRVSTDFLLSHSEAAPHSEREEDLLRIFRTLSPEEQSIFLEQGKVFIRVRSQEQGSKKAPSPANKAGKPASVPHPPHS